MVSFYRDAKKRFDDDKDFQNDARAEVVELQSGNEVTLKVWKAICDLSRIEFQEIYDRLDIQVEERGESYYNPLLDNIVTELKAKNILEESEGAQCVFLDDYVAKDGTRLPLIVQKTDGGYLYATTDLAAVKQRCGSNDNEENADRVLYVTDIGQSQHFDMVFKTASQAGLTGDSSLEHVSIRSSVSVLVL